MTLQTPARQGVAMRSRTSARDRAAKMPRRPAHREQRACPGAVRCRRLLRLCTHETRHPAFTVCARERAGRIATAPSLSSHSDVEACARRRIALRIRFAVMGRSLSYDAIFAALTVLTASTTGIGCSKSEPARAVEEKAAPAATTTSEPAAAATVVAPTAATSAALDAGREVESAPSSAPAPARNKASASCGAQGCSPDMKKGK